MTKLINDGPTQELLAFFNGDMLAVDVWYNKYRMDGEITPHDMSIRHAREIAEKLFNRLLTVDASVEGLSGAGIKLISTLKSFDIDELTTWVSERVNLNGCILGGSMLQGIGNHSLFSTLSNCFVLGQPHDSYSGIDMKTLEISQVMKRRGGGGLDLSTIRPTKAIVHNQARYSSGPVLFAEGYSHKTKEIAQDGRRGALMISLDIRHPDSFNFITAKQDLTSITGANISVKIPDDFMQAVESDSDYYLRFPVDSTFDFEKLPLGFLISPYNELVEVNNIPGLQYIKRIKAKEYWETLIKCAHATAEPGIIFTGNWEKGGLDYAYEKYRPISTNPCSEIPMQAYDACRLIARNLYTLVKHPFEKNNYIDIHELFETFYEQLLIADILIDLEVDYIDRIIDKISKGDDPTDLKKLEIDIWLKIQNMAISGRRCGCGFTALGDTLAAMNLDYNVASFIESLFSIKMKAELEATIDLAILFGAFEGFDKNIEMSMTYNKTVISQEFPEQYERMLKYGRRNVSWSTAAPTGSISILTQTTSGIEPLFLCYYKRRKKCILSTDRVDYIDPADGQKFSEYFVLHPKFIEWFSKTGLCPAPTFKEAKTYLETLSENDLKDIFKKSPWFNNCANDIHWKDRIRIQSIVQKYTTHAISSTINLPNDVDKEIISKIYLNSWKSGLKGNTVYRDGSRGGVLVSSDTGKIDAVLKDNDFYENKAPMRPKRLKANYHTIKNKNKTYSVIIGLLQNKPYEIFIVSGISNLPEVFDETTECIEGELVKESKDWYNFESKTFILKDIPDIQNEEKTLSIMLSGLLRHRTPLKFVIKMLDKTNPIAGSFTHKLIKILSQYLTDDEKLSEPCPNCGSELIHENGCVLCKSCGHSKC